MMRGQKRRLENLGAAKGIDADLNMNIHNRFDIEVINTLTGEVKQTAFAENMILNQLWTQLLNNYFAYIQYGTGTGTQAASRTSLFSYLGYASASNAVESVDYTTGVYWLRKQITLSETTAVGSTLTEVGIAYGTGSTTLCTHAMLKDMNGNQISIVKTATDIINIYATVFVHFKPTGYGGINICGTLLLRKLAGSSAGSIPTSLYCNYGKGYGKEFTPVGTNTLTSAYNATNKTITLTMTRIAASAQNVGGIAAINIGDTLFLPVGGGWYSGNTITGEAIGTGDGSTKDFSTDFPFAASAKIYVDGVEQSSGVTVDSIPGRLSDFGSNFNCIDSTGNPFFSVLPSGSNMTFGISGTYYFENPYYSTIGITSIAGKYIAVYVSNDLTNWQTISTWLNSTMTIPEDYQNYRYWKVETEYGSGYFRNLVASISDLNIHFDSAPASGAVITADYKTSSIAKDSNHVFDCTLTITLSEKTT